MRFMWKVNLTCTDTYPFQNKFNIALHVLWLGLLYHNLCGADVGQTNIHVSDREENHSK